MANHDVIVKSGLTADEYLSFHTNALEMGATDAGCLRILVVKFNRECAMTKLSMNQLEEESTKTVLFQTDNLEGENCD